MTFGAKEMARLAELGAATVYEAHGEKGALDPAIKPLERHMRVAGRAVTPSVFNMMLLLGRDETIARLQDAAR